MTLTRGFRFGSYEVLALLGVGGMGEVYRARDTKLNRDVALKILPDIFSADADRCARFEREAQILASLCHPAIGAIYGLEDAQSAAPDGTASRALRALVLELIDGPTLADEIAHGPLPVKRALEIARQIADALEAAHDSGIVHRDLKPANVKVRPDGLVKVLDFGLAKALDSPARAETSPGRTLLSPALTEVGMLFGTAAYMSPEQARGRAADKRCDVWAFGCVLYEMLTGQRAFPGDDVSDVVAAILRGEPDWSALPAGVRPQVHKLLRRCLEKDRTRRLRDVGDAGLEIDDALGAPDGPPRDSRGRAGRERIAWAAGGVALAALAALAAARWNGNEAPRAAEMRLDVTTPETTSPMSFAISPDGRSLVFNAEGPRGPQLWLRTLDGTTSRPLAGTEGGHTPFWSPDGRSIGFFTISSLKRVDIDGGLPQPLAPVLTPAGGSWSPDGTILYVPRNNAGVYRVPARGGESVEALRPGARPLATQLPQFLPDGRHFIFYVAGEDESTGIYLGDLQSDATRRVLAANTTAVYAAGRLWFVNEGTLFAQELDASTWELRGSAVRVADDIGVDQAAVAVSVSAAGTVAYRSGTRHLRRQLVWFDRAGRRLGALGEPDNTRVSNPSLSPDGRTLLVHRSDRQNVDLWSVDVDRNVFTRLTTSPAVDSMPLWAPDGIRFVAISAADRSLLIRRSDGSGADEAVGSPGAPPQSVNIATDWSPDGRALLLKVVDLALGTWDLALLPLEGSREQQLITSTPYDERDGQFSPDGHWLAFESNESGTPEIYVQPFPGPGLKLRISTASGTQARWRRDGQELFYVALDGMLMAVPVDPTAGRAGFGTPAPLFKTRLPPAAAISRQHYVVSNDGERFLMVTMDDAPTPPITLLLNWQPPPAR